MTSEPAPMLGVAPMLLTRDMAASIAFYVQVLGFTLEGQWPDDNPCWCSLRHGRASVMFHVNDCYGTTPPTLTGRLYFYTADVMEMYERVQNQATIIEGPEVYFYKMKEFAMLDNNGYVLAFGQDTEESPTCGETHDHA